MQFGPLLTLLNFFMIKAFDDRLFFEVVTLLIYLLLKYRRKPRIWSHLLKKSLMENFIFCAVWEKYEAWKKKKNPAKQVIK